MLVLVIDDVENRCDDWRLLRYLGRERFDCEPEGLLSSSVLSTNASRDRLVSEKAGDKLRRLFLGVKLRCMSAESAKAPSCVFLDVFDSARETVLCAAAAVGDEVNVSRADVLSSDSRFVAGVVVGSAGL